MVADDPSATDDVAMRYLARRQPLSVHWAGELLGDEIESRTRGRWLCDDLAPTMTFLRDFVFHSLMQKKAFRGLPETLADLTTALKGSEEGIEFRLVGNRETTTEEPPAAEGVVATVEQETHVTAVRWLEEHVGLSQEAIGELVGVSRQAVYNWLYKGADIRDENRQRLLAVREVLERVQRQHRGTDALKTWLDTPRGPEAITPRRLLIANEIGKARALSLSAAPPREQAAAKWLRESPPDPWTLRQRHRREQFLRDEPASDASSGEDAMTHE
jgi:hypothetical protein